MRVVICPSAEEVAYRAADVVERLLQDEPRAVLALPTGRTPLAMYEELVRRHRESGLSFSRMRAFNLDEYVGLAPDDPSSFCWYMRHHFFQHVDVPAKQYVVPNGFAPDLTHECRTYEERIRAAGGLDLAILGVGEDGHIAFNEPSSSLGSRTRVKMLARSTIEANRSSFPPGAAVPEKGLTMGVGTIMDARRIMLLATGAKKAEIMARALEGPISSMVPASAMQLHPQTLILLDEPAASRLELREYYEDAHRWGGPNRGLVNDVES